MPGLLLSQDWKEICFSSPQFLTSPPEIVKSLLLYLTESTLLSIVNLQVTVAGLGHDPTLETINY